MTDDRMTGEILDLFADGLTADEVLGEMPEIQPHHVAKSYVDEVVDLYNSRTGANLAKTSDVDEA